MTVPVFIHDLENGTPGHIYTSEEWVDLSKTPIPLWNLVNVKKYAEMNIQYSRGCPYDCDFCEISYLYGRFPRLKETSQLISELDAIYDTGWRGGVFFVDDNFIGNKKKIKEEVLPTLIAWMKQRKYPFSFHTEASINLSDDEELMHLMVQAGFNIVFIGIETPSEEGLAECNKVINKNRDLVGCVRRIQRIGMEVQGGFIIGFDSDTDSIFEKMIDFIQNSGIVTAMVGLLNAPKGSKLHRRLYERGRLIGKPTGDNTSISMNFEPVMEKGKLISGYRKVINTIYSPKYYYERTRKFLENYNCVTPLNMNLDIHYILAFFRSILRLGIIGGQRRYYWKVFLWALFNKPKTFPLAITFSVYGYHFRKVFKKTLWETF